MKTEWRRGVLRPGVGGCVRLLMGTVSVFVLFCILKLDEGDDRVTINILKILIMHRKWMDFVACK